MKRLRWLTLPMYPFFALGAALHRTGLPSELVTRMPSIWTLFVRWCNDEVEV